MTTRKLDKPPSENRKDLLLESLRSFYHGKGYLKKYILPIIREAPTDLDDIKKTKMLSLRTLDWLLTNYSKKEDIIIEKKNSSGNQEYISIFRAYRSQLRAYTKRNFDPFCRRDRVTDFSDGEKKIPVSTVGQLNFFRWSIYSGVLEYARNHQKEIEDDMLKSLSQPQKFVRKRKGRRKELSSSKKIMTCRTIHSNKKVQVNLGQKEI